MTATQQATITCARSILGCPPEDLQKEPTDCLLREINVALEHLAEIRAPGVLKLQVDLNMLRANVLKRKDAA